MLGRVCAYMGIDAATIDLILYEDSTPSYEGHWRESTAGLYQAHEGRFRIWIEVSNLDDPLAMVATMSHELGRLDVRSSFRQAMRFLEAEAAASRRAEQRDAADSR